MSKSKSSTHLSQVERLLQLEEQKPDEQKKQQPQQKSQEKGLKSKSKQKKRKPRAKAKPKEKQEKKETNNSKSKKNSKKEQKTSKKSEKQSSSGQSLSQDHTPSKNDDKNKSKSQKQEKTKQDNDEKPEKKKAGGRKKKQGKSVTKNEMQQTKKPRGKKEDKNDKQSSVGDNASARQLVLDYVTKQNRPYSLINIFDNLHKAVKKPTLQSILEQLSSDKEVTIKQFGKVKIYMLYQDQFKISNQEMEKLTVELGNLRQEEKQLNNQNKSLGNSLRTILAKPTLEQMKQQQNILEAQISKLQQKMDVYGNNWVGVPQQKVVQVQKRTSKNIKQAKKRQKLVKSIIKDLQQITGMKRNQLIDKLGVEMSN